MASQLQFADDTSVLARDSASCQQMLNVTDTCLTWAQMKAKPSKCQAIALCSRSSAVNCVYNPNLTIGDIHPFSQSTTCQIPWNAPMHHTIRCQPQKCFIHQDRVCDEELMMLHWVVKLVRIYRWAMLDRLAWDLKLYYLPRSFIQRSLEAVCNRFLKKWLEMLQCANPNILYIGSNQVGLGLPSITSFNSSAIDGKWTRLALYTVTAW